jgi:serine/threonine-protein kinase
LWQADRARHETRTARAVQDFLIRLFDASDPQQAQGRDVSAKELLDRGSARLDSELQDQPEVLARLHHEVGGIYIQLGSNVQARPHLEKSLSLYRALGLEGREDAIEAEFNLSELLQEELQFEPAREAALRCLALAERYFGPDNRWRLPAQEQLAAVDMDQGRSQAGADRLSAAIVEAERFGRGAEVRVVKARAHLANAHLALGSFALARDEFMRVVRDSGAIAGYEITDTLVDRYNLARARYNLREFSVVDSELEILVPLMDKHIGPRHDRTIKARSLWAQTLGELGRYQQAVEIERVNLANARARTTFDEDIVSLQELTLAKMLKLAMRPRDGLPLARSALSFMDAKYADPTWLTEVGRRLLAELLLEDGRIDEAWRTLAEAESRSQRIDSFAQSTNFAELLQAQASALRVRAHPGDAERVTELLGRARAIYDEALGAGNSASLRVDVQVAWLRARGPGADAAAEQRFLVAADAYERSLPAGHLGRAEIDWMRAELGRRAGASEALRLQAGRHEKAARDAWRAALGSELMAPLSVLH